MGVGGRGGVVVVMDSQRRDREMDGETPHGASASGWGLLHASQEGFNPIWHLREDAFLPLFPRPPSPPHGELLV